MSIAFSQATLNGPERQTILQAVQIQMQQAMITALRPLLTAFLAEEVRVKLGRAAGLPRTITTTPRTIDWACGHCGCTDANQFIRDGHYQRSLATGWGMIDKLRVPMLECQCCGHDVVVHWAILEKYQRFWLDFDQRAVFGSGGCHSLRQLAQEWSALLGSSVGLRTINARIQQVEALITRAQAQPITDVPAVVQLDGIWISVQTPSATIKCDRAGRKRQQRSGKRMVVLVALGVWSDGSGRRMILDWELADSESALTWERLVHRLWQRGLRPEQGLQALVRDGGDGLGEAIGLVYGTRVVDQRCIFHKLKNVTERLTGDLTDAQKKELQQDAHVIYCADDAASARRRLAAFGQKWRALQPHAVATLERDFETSIAYYQLDNVAGKFVRTTSLLERTNRELRRKFRQVGIFGSICGLQVGVYIQVARLHCWWAKQSWWTGSQAIIFDLLNLHP